MIEPPTEYERAVAEAIASVGPIVTRVYCREHDSQAGAIRYTPYGELLWVDVPLETGAGAASYIRRLKQAVGKRPPQPHYAVRALIDRMDEAPDPPQAWCEVGSHRIFLEASDFVSHSGDRVRLKRVKSV